MNIIRIIAIAGMTGFAAYNGHAESGDPPPFCEFEHEFLDTQLRVSGGSKSWSITTYFSMQIAEGVTAEFRSLNAMWGFEEYSPYGQAKLSLFNDGTVYFRSHYPVTKSDPRVGVDVYLTGQGKTLLLVLANEDGTGNLALAGVTHQVSGQVIDLFTTAKSPQTDPLRARIDSGQPFRLRLGAEGILIAESPDLEIAGLAEAKAYGEGQFVQMQADAEAGLCL